MSLDIKQLLPDPVKKLKKFVIKDKKPKFETSYLNLFIEL